MSHFDDFAGPQSCAGALVGLNNAGSVRATARFGSRRRESLSLVGSATFCRPRSWGSQFSGAEFVAEVARIGSRQSMDGKGCCRDNVFVERLWRSVKCEEVYLKAYDSVSAARQGLAAYIDSYNGRRPHQSHDGCTPDMIYFTQPL
jgi:transposase InsO family protein